jgi:hypothetical protein
MPTFNSFKEWYSENGTKEELSQLSNLEVLNGLKSIVDIKSALIQSQKYEMAARARDLEKTLYDYINEHYCKLGLGFTCYNMTDVQSIIKYELKIVNRNESIDRITKNGLSEEED